MSYALTTLPSGPISAHNVCPPANGKRRRRGGFLTGGYHQQHNSNPCPGTPPEGKPDGPTDVGHRTMSYICEPQNSGGWQGWRLVVTLCNRPVRKVVSGPIPMLCRARRLGRRGHSYIFNITAVSVRDYDPNQSTAVLISGCVLLRLPPLSLRRGSSQKGSEHSAAKQTVSDRAGGQFTSPPDDYSIRFRAGKHGSVVVHQRPLLASTRLCHNNNRVPGSQGRRSEGWSRVGL